MLDLPAVEQWLAHDLLIRQVLHCYQPVRMQLTEGINVGCHPCRCVDEAGAEAGEGQVSAEMCCCCGGVLSLCSAVRGMDSQLSKKAFQDISRRPMTLAWRAVS